MSFCCCDTRCGDLLGASSALLCLHVCRNTTSALLCSRCKTGKHLKYMLPEIPFFPNFRQRTNNKTERYRGEKTCNYIYVYKNLCIILLCTSTMYACNVHTSVCCIRNIQTTQRVNISLSSRECRVQIVYIENNDTHS